MCHDTNLLCYTSWNIVRLNAFTNHKHAISFLCSRDACSLESRLFHRFRRGGHNLYNYCGQRTISARRYLSRASAIFKGLIETGKEVIDVERLDRDYEDILRSVDRNFGLHLRIITIKRHSKFPRYFISHRIFHLNLL